jgi:hypothetical protein
MPEPLASEELAKLESQLPNFRESPRLQYWAERKLLPQQNDIPSFENPDFLTGLRRATYGLTRKEQQLIKRQEEALVPFEQEQELKNKLQVMQKFALANAPTYGEAQERGIGLPSPMQDVPHTFPGSAELPGTFNIDELQPGPMVGMTPSSATSPGIPIREAPTYQPTTMPFRQPNPAAKLSPTDLQFYEKVIGGHGVMDKGQYVPMQLAKLPGSLLAPEEANAYLESVGVPVLKPFTQPVSSSMLTEIMKQHRGEGQPPLMKLQQEKNRIEAIPRTQRSQGQQEMLETVTGGIRKLNLENPDSTNEWAGAIYGPGVSYKNLDRQPPLTPTQSQELAQLYRVRVPAGTRPMAAVKAAQSQMQQMIAARSEEFKREIPLGLDASNYARLLPNGRIEKALGTMSKNEAITEGHVNISAFDQEMKQVNAAPTAMEIVDRLHGYAKEMITAGPGILSRAGQFVELSVAGLQQAGRPTNVRAADGTPLTLGEVVNLYNTTAEANADLLTRAGGGQVGVATEKDTVRSLMNLATTADTVNVMNDKFTNFRHLFQSRYERNLHLVFGEPSKGGRGRVSVDEKLDQLLNQLKKTK